MALNSSAHSSPLSNPSPNPHGCSQCNSVRRHISDSKRKRTPAFYIKYSCSMSAVILDLNALFTVTITSFQRLVNEIILG